MLSTLDPNEVLAAAQNLSRKGMSVIPLHAKKKTPAVTEWTTFQSAIASPHKLIEWFANDPRNLGLVTGAVSNVVVLDVDQLEGLQTIEPLPLTPTVITGKGKHYYFRHPGFDVKNIKLEGLGDVRGDGGYVVTAPSIHENGKRYAWEVGPDTPLAELPKWLLEKLQPKEVPQAGTSDGVTTAYGKPWFSDVEELACAHEGGRNMLLNDVACKAGSLIAGGHLSDYEARSAMIDACKRNGLVYDEASGGLRAVQATMKSGLQTGMRNPREKLKPEDALPVFKGGKLQLRRMSDVEVENIDWLWKGVLAKGHITLISGDPGTGKSQLSLSLAAIVSNGGKWPVTGDAVEPGNVIILSREDRAEDVIKPRLLAAGADESRVFIVGDVADGSDGREFRLKEDMPLLKQACEELGQVSYIVIDPISSYMGDGDINNAGDVRSITNDLASLAQQYMASVVMITHNSKGQGTAGTKVTGSHAWLASARCTFSVTKDDDSEVRTMAPIKINIAKDTEAYSFTVRDASVAGGIETSCVEWQNFTTKKTADQVLQDRSDGSKGRAASEIVEAMIANGPRKLADIKRQLEGLELSTATLYRVRDKLRIRTATIDGEAAWEREPEIAPFSPVFS